MVRVFRVKRSAAKKAPKKPLRILIPSARLQRRVRDIARQIRKDFPGEPLHLVGVLKGAVFFLSDLARELRGGGDVSFDFIAVSSYGKDKHSSGEVRLTRD